MMHSSRVAVICPAWVWQSYTVYTMTDIHMHNGQASYLLPPLKPIVYKKTWKQVQRAHL